MTHCPTGAAETKWVGKAEVRSQALRSRELRVAKGRSADGGLSVCFPPVADVEDADDARRGVVLVYHTVVTNPDKKNSD